MSSLIHVGQGQKVFCQGNEVTRFLSGTQRYSEREGEGGD